MDVGKLFDKAANFTMSVVSVALILTLFGLVTAGIWNIFGWLAIPIMWVGICFLYCMSRDL